MYAISMDEQFSPTPGYLIWKLAGNWRLAVDRALAPHALTHAQYIVLSTLYGMQDGVIDSDRLPSQRQLADHAGLEALYLSKLVRSLEADGLVIRTRDQVDTRTIRLTLTQRGRELARPALAVVSELVDQLLAPLGGQGSKRSAAFTRDLTTLLNTPLGTSL